MNSLIPWIAGLLVAALLARWLFRILFVKPPRIRSQVRYKLPTLGELIEVPVPGDRGTLYIPGRFAGTDDRDRVIIQPTISGYGTEIRSYDWGYPLFLDDEVPEEDDA